MKRTKRTMIMATGLAMGLVGISANPVQSSAVKNVPCDSPTPITWVVVIDVERWQSTAVDSALASINNFYSGAFLCSEDYSYHQHIQVATTSTSDDAEAVADRIANLGFTPRILFPPGIASSFPSPGSVFFDLQLTPLVSTPSGGVLTPPASKIGGDPL